MLYNNSNNSNNSNNNKNSQKFLITINLKKNIPNGAGLGGGSSDAAMVLKILNNKLHLHLSENILLQIAQNLGADVPFFIKENKQVVVLILSQTSRDGWKKASKNEGCYDLTALADSNELERAASLVLTVYCSTSLKQVKEAKVQILKNRDGDIWRRTYGDIC